jgi:hypothetical protein
MMFMSAKILMPISRFVIRFHLVMIVLSTLVSGLLSSRFLLHLGVENMALRYGLASLIAYDVFLVLGRFWLGYVSARARLQQQASRVNPALLWSPQSRAKKEAGGDQSLDVTDGADLIDLAPDSFDADEGIGAAIYLVILVVIGAILIAGGIFVIVEAQILFFETLFHAILTAAFVRALNRMEREDWALSLLKETWIPFVIMLVAAAACGYWAQLHCPAAETMVQAFTCQ